jgi:Sec-independent protein translocase protein TatA
MGLFGVNEMLLIGGAAVALLLGPKKLPELAGALGKSKQEYHTSMQAAADTTADADQ